MLVFVTGSPGVGKTTLVEALIREGVRAFDADSLSSWYNKSDWQKVDLPDSERTPMYLKKYAWLTDLNQVAALKEAADNLDDVVFLAGIMGNFEEVEALADLVVLLDVPESVLESRLTTRNCGFGEFEHEVAGALSRHGDLRLRHQLRGSALLDGTNQPQALATGLLNLVQSSKAEEPPLHVLS